MEPFSVRNALFLPESSSLSNEVQHFIVLEGLIAAGDDALVGVQAFEHFIVLRILTVRRWDV